MASLDSRMSALEARNTNVKREILILLHTQGRDKDDIVGISWLDDIPRLSDEPYDTYIARVECHLRATRGNAGPLISFAEYGDEELVGL